MERNNGHNCRQSRDGSAIHEELRTEERQVHSPVYPATLPVPTDDGERDEGVVSSVGYDSHHIRIPDWFLAEN
jgi:hypothetical protein